MAKTSHGAAIVVAAGSSRRMGADKVLTRIRGCPVLEYSLRVLDAHPAIGEIIVVASAENFRRVEELVGELQLATPALVALGGARRQDSVRSGMRQADPGFRWILIHDAARPFIEPDLIDRGIAACLETGAAVAGVPSRDTAKIVGPDRLVRQTVERSLLWLIQTPQLFLRDRLEAAFDQIEEEVTDEAVMLELCGQQVQVFEGSWFNMKLTVPEDLVLAEAIAGHLAEAG